MVKCAKDDVFLCFIRVYTLAFVASEAESETTAVSPLRPPVPPTSLLIFVKSSICLVEPSLPSRPTPPRPPPRTAVGRVLQNP